MNLISEYYHLTYDHLEFKLIFSIGFMSVRCESCCTFKVFLMALNQSLAEYLRYKFGVICSIFLFMSLFLPIRNGECHDKKAPRYPHFEGKIINSIQIKLRDIFDEPDLNFLYSTANNLKINTRQGVIKKEILFKEGHPFNEFVIEESERNLRSLKYIRNVNIEPVPNGDQVDILIHVQDTWTLIPQVSFSSGTGKKKASAGMAESNLLGYGKRLEALYQEDDSRESVAFAYDDDRIFGTRNNLTTAYAARTDGETAFLAFGRPFRSLVEKESWNVTTDYGDTIGRLFEASDERYIFRQENIELSSRYTVAIGDPEDEIRRFAIGYDYISDTFTQANADDYDDLNLDPNEVNNDPTLLAENRRFTGPAATYRFIEADFISMNYIDRFDRLEDYNLGQEFSVNSMFAPTFAGSKDDTYLLSTNFSDGFLFNKSSFIRSEFGYASRYDHKGDHNTLYRGELKYYDVLGVLYWGERFLGKHTLALAASLDYGDDLDKDRELLIGGDNAIRGYRARTFSGDKRLAFNFEDRIHIAEDVFKLISIGAAAFVDAGSATNEPLGTMFTDHMYADVGFGLRFAFPRSTGAQVFRIDIALPLRDGPDGSGELEPRLLLTGGQIFGARLRSETLGSEKASVDVGFDK